MNRSIVLAPVAPLAPIIGDGELVAFSAGPDRVVYLVIAFDPLEDRIENLGGASFARTVAAQPRSYRVVGLFGSRIMLDLTIQRERFHIHDIQPLRDDLLLVCARSHYRGPDDFEKNGRVYSRDGNFLSEILLGDGIRSVRTTTGGLIWTSYFDEGVFGNFGWSEPVGASGLVAWDSEGNQVYEFRPCDGLDWICDCYALNVESEEDVWLYYYTDFPLVRIRRRQIDAFWKMPFEGSKAFAVAEGHALFYGGYDDANSLYLCFLTSGDEARLLAKIELRDRDGAEIVASHVTGRADTLFMISHDCLYQFDVRSALESLRSH